MSHETGRAAGIAGDIPAPKRLCAREHETSCLLWHPLASYIQRHGQLGHYTWHITAIPGEMLELAPCNGILFFWLGCRIRMPDCAQGEQTPGIA